MYALMLGLYLQYSRSAFGTQVCNVAAHITSVIYVKCVYSAPCHIVDCSDFICGTHLFIHPPCKHIKCMVCMPYLMGLFVPSTYLAIAFEVCIAVGCIFDICAEILGMYTN